MKWGSASLASTLGPLCAYMYTVYRIVAVKRYLRQDFRYSTEAAPALIGGGGGGGPKYAGAPKGVGHFGC